MARTPTTATAVDTGTGEVEALKAQLLSTKKDIAGLKEHFDSRLSEIVSCECGKDDITEQLEKKLDVLLTYVKTFNNFLNSSMISNNADKAAEDALTDILVDLPKDQETVYFP